MLNEWLLTLARWLDTQSWSTQIHESIYLYAWIETTHVLTLMVFLGMLFVIDLRMLSYPFAVLEVNGASASIALDDIYWSGGLMNIADRQAAGLHSLEAFPNPSAGEFTLRWTQQVAGSVQWEVRNSAGALVMLEREDLVPSGERAMTLDASNWAEGVYFVTRTDRGSQETLRLVLTK